MRRLLLQRLAVLPVLLLGVTFVVFLSVHMIPGDPARVMLGQNATEEQVQAARHQLGLDQPLMTQYLLYVGRLLHADLGQSVFNQQPVAEEIGHYLPSSIELTFTALLIGVPIGLFLGVRAAVRRNSVADNVSTTASLVGLSIPTFWLGLLLAWVFGVKLGWLPLSGRLPPFTEVNRITGLTSLDALIQGQWGTFWDSLQYLVLPALTLAVIPLALVARFSRGAFVEVLSQDYMRTARAYGLGERRIVWQYAAKNASLPLVTLLGVLVPALLSGAVLVETVFGWPGLGSYLLQAITTRNYPVIMSVTLIFAVIYVIANLLVDLAYLVLDPRIRTT